MPPRRSADLTVVSWGGAYQDAQRKIYFEPFKKATGIKLVEDSWNGGIGTLRAKVEGGNADLGRGAGRGRGAAARLR